MPYGVGHQIGCVELNVTEVVAFLQHVLNGFILQLTGIADDQLLELGSDCADAHVVFNFEIGSVMDAHGIRVGSHEQLEGAWVQDAFLCKDLGPTPQQQSNGAVNESCRL